MKINNFNNQFMSREIKFRAWIKTPQGCYMAIQGTPDIETLQSFMFHYGDRELMQFTGLKDKNGCEIYEGDIMRNSHSVLCMVKFEHGGFYAIGKGAYIIPTYFWNCKVIGNIYDNPELLS